MSILSGYILPHPPIAVPEIGKGEEKQIQKTLDGYDAVAQDIARLAPDTILLSSPHAFMYRDYFYIAPGAGTEGSLSRFNAPDVKFHVTYDTELTQTLFHLAESEDFPAGPLGERTPSLTPDHGTMVPLYFVNRRYSHYKLVRIGLSGLSLEAHWKLGQLIAKAAEQTHRRCVYIASGDLSHCQKEEGPYGFHPEGPAYDKRVLDVLGRGDFKALLDFDPAFLSAAEECGHRSFTIMAGALSGSAVTPRILSHENTFGVGYGTGIFAAEDPCVALARQSIRTYVKEGVLMAPPKNIQPALLNRRAGAFVSIHENGQLRGCIGTFLPTRANLADEIVHNAAAAATEDPRFRPITADELKHLDISVDILSEPEPIASADVLDPKRYGVIVTCGSRRGLLLPDLEGVDTPAQQIAICRQKAGIGPEEPVSLMRFEVIRHEALK
ncbi:MAG: AmmeMemoRadiSam system protein A [Pseudoramibacter sp.]